MTRYTYRTTITVTVDMTDEGEREERDSESSIMHWDSPEDQERSAQMWAIQALPLADYVEDWVYVDAPPLKLVSTCSVTQPSAGPEQEEEPICTCGHGLHSHVSECDLCGGCTAFVVQQERELDPSCE